MITGSVQEVRALSFPEYDDLPVYLGNDRFRYIKNDHAAILDLEGNVIVPYGSTFNDYCFWGFVETEDGIADLNGKLVLPVGNGQENAWQDITLYDDGRMAGLGVVGGVGNGKFNTGGQLTREQAATILARLAEAMGQPLPVSAPTFADNGLVSDWAQNAVGQMQASGVMSGTGNNNFSPLQSYTREQCMMTVLRMYEQMK